MDFTILYDVYAYELTEGDIFEHESHVYTALSVSDDDTIVILAEGLTYTDDVVTLELEPHTRVSILNEE